MIRKLVDGMKRLDFFTYHSKGQYEDLNRGVSPETIESRLSWRYSAMVMSVAFSAVYLLSARAHNEFNPIGLAQKVIEERNSLEKSALGYKSKNQTSQHSRKSH